eukprot:3140630-Amphidinium_carterae.1
MCAFVLLAVRGVFNDVESLLIIARGGGGQHKVHKDNDPLVRCVTSAVGNLHAIGIWERYWFEVVPQSYGASLA